MKVGDLVEHHHTKQVGMILDVPSNTPNGDYLVRLSEGYSVYYPEESLKLIKPKKDYCPNHPCHCGACERQVIKKWAIDEALNGRR
tara:strand:+ start:448 stop:705 length:258 start_codon:yes stop_codon:yes gene_type:complete